MVLFEIPEVLGMLLGHPVLPKAGWIDFGNDFGCQMDAERADFGSPGITWAPTLGGPLGVFGAQSLPKIPRAFFA